MKSKELLDYIVQTVIKENDKQMKMTKKQHRDWRLRNTSLLLKNYRMLKIHCDSVVEDLEVYQDMVYDPKGLRLDTLMQYKSKTAKMLLYFDSMFKAYGELSIRGGYASERRYKVIKRMYIDDAPASAISMAEYFNVDRSTVTRDINKAIEELSILLFGIESFDDLE